MKVIQNNSVVDINLIRPNDFNPKPDYKNDRELSMLFDKLTDSISHHGQTLPLLVREDGDKYEIIDGEHRYYAMLELGYKYAEIKNLGEINRVEAIKKLFSSELRFEVDPLEEAKLLKELHESNISLEGLPFTIGEIEEKISLLDFNPETYGLKGIESAKEKEADCPFCEFHFKY